MNKYMLNRKMKPGAEKGGKVTVSFAHLKMPKISPSCRNPRWNKTARGC